jgi:hypothetical protein
MKSAQIIIERIIYITILLIIILITRCEKEKPVIREYPRLTGTSVTNISDSGATFSTQIFSMGSEISNEIGFVWGTETSINYEWSNKVILGKPEKIGIFSADVRAALIKDIEYNVKSFVKTEKRIVYGPITKFKSLGCNAPVIYKFSPASASWRDTVKISGKNFSYVTVANEIKLNQVNCCVISSTDTTIFFVVDPLVISLKNIISVGLAGNISEFTRDSFRLIPPKIKDFHPRQAYWGDTLKIKGKNLQFIGYRPTNYIKIGTFNCSLVSLPADSVLKIKIPYEISIKSMPLSININGIILEGPAPFTLLPPYFTFSPLEGTWSDTVTLCGRFNKITSRNTVYFNNIQATILSVSDTIMTVKVPLSLPDIKSAIKYVVTPWNVVSADSFNLLPPVIKSFSPLSGQSNTIVTIKGKYFNSRSATVKFGTENATIISINDSTIITKVTSDRTGEVKINIKIYNQSVTSDDDFLLTNPKITEVFPLIGTFDDEITISGENFVPDISKTSVNFGGISASVSSANESEIVVRVPMTMDSIPRCVTVISGSVSVTSIEKFILKPPVILSVSPSTLIPGQDLVITGENFNPIAINNNVYWDIYPLNIKSSGKNEIIATWPSVLPRGIFPLKLVSGGYSRTSTDKFQSNSLFQRLEAPRISTNFNTGFYYGISNYSAGINNYGYIASPSASATYRFDPSDNSWLKLAGFPYPFHPVILAGFTTVGDTLYIIGGNYTNDIFAFDPLNAKWRSVNYLEFRLGCVAFTLNNKIHAGLDFIHNYTNFYEIDPSNNYNPVRKGDFPVSPTASFSSYFTVNNKGYVVFSNNEVWQFDQESLTWLRKSDFPSTARTFAVSFVIGSDAYFGTGSSSSGINLNDIWKYNSVSDTWTLACEIPTGRYSALAFTLNNKAYIGFGVNSKVDLYDFYEFDPNYLMK